MCGFLLAAFSLSACVVVSGFSSISVGDGHTVVPSALAAKFDSCPEQSPCKAAMGSVPFIRMVKNAAEEETTAVLREHASPDFRCAPDEQPISQQFNINIQISCVSTVAGVESSADPMIVRVQLVSMDSGLWIETFREGKLEDTDTRPIRAEVFRRLRDRMRKLQAAAEICSRSC